MAQAGLSDGAFANHEYEAVSTSGGAGAEEYQAVRTDAAGNSYVLTLIQGQAKFGGVTVVAPGAKWEYGLLKLDPTGQALWYRKIKRLDANQLLIFDAALHTDAAGNSWLAVTHPANDTIGGVVITTIAGRHSITVTKYDANGTQLWARWEAQGNSPNATTRTIHIGHNHPLTVLANGEIVLGGTMVRAGFNYFNGGATVSGSRANRGFLVKLNASGVYVKNMLAENALYENGSAPSPFVGGSGSQIMEVASSGNRLYMCGKKYADTLRFPKVGGGFAEIIQIEPVNTLQGNAAFIAQVDPVALQVTRLVARRELREYLSNTPQVQSSFMNMYLSARSDSGAYLLGVYKASTDVRDPIVGDFTHFIWDEGRLYGLFGAPQPAANGYLLDSAFVFNGTPFMPVQPRTPTSVEIRFQLYSMEIQSNNGLLLRSKHYKFHPNPAKDRVTGDGYGVTKVGPQGTYEGTVSAPPDMNASPFSAAIAPLPEENKFVMVGTYTGSVGNLSPFTITAPGGSAGTNGYWAKYGAEIVVAPSCTQPVAKTPSVSRCGSGLISASVGGYQGCQLQWYLGSTGIGSAFIGDSTVFFALGASDTLYARSICDTTCASAFTKIPITIRSGSFNLNLSPSSARVGETVTITGINLDHLGSLTLNGTPLSYQFVSATQVTFVVPVGAASGSVRAEGDSISDLCPEAALFSLNTAPVGCSITLTSSSGSPGQQIGITGPAVGDVYMVSLAGAPVGFRQIGDTLYFIVPANAQSGDVETVSGIDSSECRGNAAFTVDAPTIRPMSGGPASVCGGLYTDPQGAAGNYSNNLYITQTLTPGTAGAKLQLDLSTVQLSDNDQLYVYNGASPASPLLFRSVGGSTAPGKLTATNGAGQLTVRFYSNGAGNAAGFAGTLTCLTGASLTPQITSISPNRGVNGQKVLLTGTNLTGTSNVRFNGRPASFTVKNALQVEATVPVNVTNGFITLETPNGSAPSPELFTVIDSLKHFSGTTLLCSGTYSDPQGPNASYLPNLYLTQTISASQPFFNVAIDFTQFDIAAGDYLYIFNGTSTASPLLVNYRGGVTTVMPDTVRSTGGALTVRFYSDGATQGAGWLANIFCTGAPVPSPSPARLGDEGLMETFAFWPNPARDKLTVRLENVNADALILFNAQGQQAFRAPVGQGVSELALPRLTPGLYIVKVGRHTARLAVE